MLGRLAVQRRPSERYFRAWVLPTLMVGVALLCYSLDHSLGAVLDLPLRFIGFMWFTLISSLAFAQYANTRAAFHLVLGTAHISASVVALSHLASARMGESPVVFSEVLWLSLLMFLGTDHRVLDALSSRRVALPVFVATLAAAHAWGMIDPFQSSLWPLPAHKVIALTSAAMMFISAYRLGRQQGDLEQALSIALNTDGLAVVAAGLLGGLPWAAGVSHLAVTAASTYLLLSVGHGVMSLFRRERRVAEYNRRAKSVIDQVACGVIVIDSSGLVAVCNPAAQRLLEIPGDFHGRPFTSLLEALPLNLSWFAGILAPAGEGRDVSVETEAGGSERHWSVQSRLVRDEAGDAWGTVIVVEDLTERKAIAARIAASERLASAGRLAALAAHEIRNPLAAIKGLLHLASTSVGKQVTTSLKACEDIIDEIERTMTQILSLVKPKNPSKSPVDLKEALAGVFFEAAPSLKDRGVKHVFRVDTPPVVADRDTVRQAVLNVIGAIADAVPTGSSLRLTAAADDSGKSATLCLEVSGVRVTGRRMEHVFEPDFRVGGAYVGFGLSIGKKLLEECGATVDAQPTANGLRLSAKLPVARGAKDRQVSVE